MKISFLKPVQRSGRQIQSARNQKWSRKLSQMFKYCFNAKSKCWRKKLRAELSPFNAWCIAKRLTYLHRRLHEFSNLLLRYAASIRLPPRSLRSLLQFWTTPLSPFRPTRIVRPYSPAFTWLWDRGSPVRSQVSDDSHALQAEITLPKWNQVCELLSHPWHHCRKKWKTSCEPSVKWVRNNDVKLT